MADKTQEWFNWEKMIRSRKFTARLPPEGKNWWRKKRRRRSRGANVEGRINTEGTPKKSSYFGSLTLPSRPIQRRQVATSGAQATIYALQRCYPATHRVLSAVSEKGVWGTYLITRKSPYKKDGGNFSFIVSLLGPFVQYPLSVVRANSRLYRTAKFGWQYIASTVELLFLEG